MKPARYQPAVGRFRCRFHIQMKSLRIIPHGKTNNLALRYCDAIRSINFSDFEVVLETPFLHLPPPFRKNETPPNRQFKPAHDQLKIASPNREYRGIFQWTPMDLPPPWRRPGKERGGAHIEMTRRPGPPFIALGINAAGISFHAGHPECCLADSDVELLAPDDNAVVIVQHCVFWDGETYIPRELLELP